LKLSDKIRILYDIINDLKQIHEKKIINHDLHSGNVLYKKDKMCPAYIADLGLSCPADQTYQTLNKNKNGIVGVLSYLAPEVLNGNPYTMASDIYSFGVLMSLISTGQQPFNNLAHDTNLAIKICEGLRPAFSNNTPKIYIELAYKCMDANPDKRPSVEEVGKIINFWRNSL